jgi:hypothetical protein
MKHKILSITLALAALTLSRSTQAQREIEIGGVSGFKDTPMLPGGKWHVHDPERPQPAVVTPGSFSSQEQPGRPPSDAIVLFDGKDLSQWRDKSGQPAPWKLENGAMISAKSDIVSTRQFGDIQLHVEFCEPAPGRGSGQGRGNSGVFLMDQYEVQVLDCYESKTYADGATAGLYGQHPPLVNACLPPGQWQVYDIIFTAPRFETNTLPKAARDEVQRAAVPPSTPQFECTDPNVTVKTPAYITVIHNGVVVQNHQSLHGPTGWRILAKYSPHGPTGPVGLQFHNDPVSFRNIWVRPIETPDDP